MFACLSYVFCNLQWACESAVLILLSIRVYSVWCWTQLGHLYCTVYTAIKHTLRILRIVLNWFVVICLSVDHILELVPSAMIWTYVKGTLIGLGLYLYMEQQDGSSFAFRFLSTEVMLTDNNDLLILSHGNPLDVSSIINTMLTSTHVPAVAVSKNHKFSHL